MKNINELTIEDSEALATMLKYDIPYAEGVREELIECYNSDIEGLVLGKYMPINLFFKGLNWLSSKGYDLSDLIKNIGVEVGIKFYQKEIQKLKTDLDTCNAKYAETYRRNLTPVSNTEQDIINAVNKVVENSIPEEKKDKAGYASGEGELKLDVKEREETLQYIRNVMTNNNFTQPDQMYHYWNNKRLKAKEMWERLEASDPLNQVVSNTDNTVAEPWLNKLFSVDLLWNNEFPIDESCKKWMGDNYEENLKSYKEKEKAVLFSNTYVEYEGCDCGGEYGCSHGSYPIGIKFLNNEKCTGDFEDENSLILYGNKNCIRIEDYTKITMGDFYSLCQLVGIELEIKPNHIKTAIADNTVKEIKQCKNEVAKLHGYPTWDDYYDWIARDGQYPGVIAQLIEAATEDAMNMYHKQFTIPVIGGTQLLKQFLEIWDEAKTGTTYNMEKWKAVYNSLRNG